MRSTGMATLTTSKGLLELYHIPADSSTPYSNGNDYSAGGVGFGHVGFTVPDVVAALARVKKFGYEVVKPLDEANEEQMGMPPEAIAGKFGEVAEGYKFLLRQLAFVKDPDVSVADAKLEWFASYLPRVGLLGRASATCCEIRWKSIAAASNVQLYRAEYLEVCIDPPYLRGKITGRW
jgi:catechol 2,3-dioxygenase-like lactoylglutathione lyase family enzyme